MAYTTLSTKPAKTSLMRLDDKPNNMIEGSDGPIIFPFAKIEDEFLRVHRGQLVHHNSEIAILVARKSKYNVSVKSRKDLKEAGEPEQSISVKSTTASSRHGAEGADGQSTIMEYHPEVESEMVGEDDVLLYDADEENVKEVELKPLQERLPRIKSSMIPRKISKLDTDKSLYGSTTSDEIDNRPGEKLGSYDDVGLSKDLGAYEALGVDEVLGADEALGPYDDLGSHKSLMADERPARPPTFARDPTGIHIPKASVKHYLQWQFDKLAQQMEDEERCTQSDISVCNIQQSTDPDAMGVGEEALQFHRTAHNLGESDFADKFLLLVGNSILSLMKKHDFLMLDLDEVLHILSSDYFGVPKERNVLRAAYAWLQFKPEERKRHTPVLMGAVRFGLLTKKEQLKCLMHNNDLLTILLNVPPFQRTFMKSCLWSYAMDTGLTTQFKDFEDQPRINYKQFFTTYRRPGRPQVSTAHGMQPTSIGPSPTGGKASAGYGISSAPNGYGAFPSSNCYIASPASNGYVASPASNSYVAFPTSNSYNEAPRSAKYGKSLSSTDIASSSKKPDGTSASPNFIVDYKPKKIGKKFRRGKGQNGYITQHIGTATTVTNQKQIVVLESKMKPTTK